MRTLPKDISTRPKKGLKELREPQSSARPQFVEYLVARLAMAKGDIKGAKATLVDVLPKLHDDPAVQKIAYLFLGQCYRQEGDIDKAVIAYSEAVKIDTYFYQARAGLAEIFMSRGKFADAAAQYVVVVNGPRPPLEALSPWHES